MGMAVARRPYLRGEVCLIELDPTRGSEIRKTRPCLVISPDELNQHLRTLVVAPMTTGGSVYPWRIACRFQNRTGFVAVDQIRTVDAERITKRLGHVHPATLASVLKILQELFSL
jgi:mRNA interferase MazF